jgi:hypothetical protein
VVPTFANPTFLKRQVTAAGPGLKEQDFHDVADPVIV